MNVKKLTRIVLIAMYPLVSAAAGVATGLVIATTMHDEPHPALYGAGTAVLMAAYMYGRTWLDFRKARRSKRV